MHRGKLILTTLTAATLLALAVGTAGAGWLSISERQFDARWRELTWGNDVNGSTLTCPLTLLGTFHSRTIRKIRGLLGGVIDHEVIGNPPSTRAACTGGNVTILTETLPWHLRYNSFSGTLPRITSVNLHIINGSWRINLPADGLTCLARADVTEPVSTRVAVNETTGQLGTLTPEGRISADDATCSFLGIKGFFTGGGIPENRHGDLLFVRLI
jgi:hypothetical protein